jgi:hypothetical protein
LATLCVRCNDKAMRKRHQQSVIKGRENESRVRRRCTRLALPPHPQREREVHIARENKAREGQEIIIRAE